MSKKLKLLCIKTDKCVYISDNIEDSKYFSSTLWDYLFDGAKAKETFRKDWYELPNVPKKIEEEVSVPSKIKHFILKKELAKEAGLDSLKEELEADYFNNIYPNNEEDITPTQEFRQRIKPLYEAVMEEFPPKIENVEFEIVVIEGANGFEIVKQEYELKHNLLDTLTVHPVLLPTKPCTLSLDDSYKIIRQYIKENINPKVARVTSDYDFCFTVSKVIPLAEVKEYQVDVNFSLFNKRKKKPKYETRIKKYKEIEIYKVAPPDRDGKPYRDYPLVKAFYGENNKDLNKNIDSFLKNLIKYINSPIKECPHCFGNGHIFDDSLLG